MSGYGTRPTAGLLDTEDRRNALAQALLGIPSRVGNAFTGMAQQGLLANERFMSGEGADQQFLPTMDSGGRLGALASFLSQNMAMGGPAGSLGAGPSMARKASALPMDDASRMARANEMFPIDAYHGTGADIRAFDPNKLGAATDNVTTRMGFHFAPTPDEANRIARVFGGDTANVLPVKLGMKNPYEMGWSEFEKIKMLEWDNRHLGDKARTVANQKADEILNGLKSAGHDGIVVTRKGHPSEYVVFDPANIRSRFAAFDPAKRNSPDLLAGYANPFGGLLQGEPQP